MAVEAVMRVKGGCIYAQQGIYNAESVSSQDFAPVHEETFLLKNRVLRGERDDGDFLISLVEWAARGESLYPF
jgi:hypothetical protein